ncbi:MAG: TMEM175 family protein [Candidatus Nanopelagicales bacterium]|nr:TMEM175 family protein [Candidatus Nanopelagicales bacterium]
MSVRRYYPTERVGALSDGVFAIVLTLLVLEFDLPESDAAGDVWVDLTDNWHELVGWLVSFTVLARMWMIHHDTFATIRRTSSRTILVNFLFLGSISLVPFAARLIGTFEFKDPASIIVFSVMLGLTGLTLGMVIAAAESDARIRRPDRGVWSWRMRHHLLVIPAISVLSCVGALLHPALGVSILAIEAVVSTVVLVGFGGEEDVESASAAGASG